MAYAMMKSRSVFLIVAVFTAIGENISDKGGVLYRYIEIFEKRGGVRRMTIVRAVEALARFIEKHAIHMFLFWEQQGERLLWCVDRADGPKRADFEALRAYAQQLGPIDAR